jgi:hypothetical protein
VIRWAAGRSGTMTAMKRVVILGRGGAGKSTLATTLGTATGIPVIELDKHFWGPELAATPPDRWAVVQGELVCADQWIMDGDLGPYDVLEVRLRGAVTRPTADGTTWCRRRPGPGVFDAFWRCRCRVWV